MKAQANSKRREVSFNVGDAVLLKLQPYRQRSLAKRKNEKLSPRYFGPYLVSKKIGAVAYELELPSSSRIHPVFHVSMLRPAVGQATPSTPPPLPINDAGELLLQPEKVLSHRWLTGGVLELLIQWQGRPHEESSWEDYDLLAVQFPEFHLEAKVNFQGRSIDKPLLTYARRKKPRQQEQQEYMPISDSDKSFLLFLSIKDMM